MVQVMTSKLGGRPTKDSPISDAFNQLKVGQTLTRKDIQTAKRAAKMEKLQQDEEKRKQREELDRLKAKVEKIAEGVGDVPATPIEPEEQEGVGVDSGSDDDEKSAYQMLQHLRYAYKNSRNSEGKKGRQRLMSLMEADSEFKFFVKELMKIEAALLAAKLRKGEDESGNRVGNQNFFVVLKGLEDEKKYLTAGVEDKTVDMKQIARAMNPDEHSYEPEEEVSQRDAPEQLQKSVENVEGW